MYSFYEQVNREVITLVLCVWSKVYQSTSFGLGLYTKVLYVYAFVSIVFVSEKVKKIYTIIGLVRKC